MKHILFIALLAFSQSAFSVNNSAPFNTLTATFQKLEIQHDHLAAATTGLVSIAEGNSEIEVDLYEVPVCPEGAACAMVIPTHHEIKLPIIDVKVGTCGETIYTAEEDATPVDGLKQTLQVIDYRTMTCDIALQYYSQTIYTTYNPWTAQTVTSLFHGEALVLKTLVFQ